MIHERPSDGMAAFQRKIARIAVLADGENIGFDAAERMMDQVRKVGLPTVLRAYCDRSNPRGWDRDARFQVVYLDTVGGKNSADIRLVIDAMDLAHSGTVDGFAILSTDSDFAPLAHRLREKGFPVLGIGRPETAARFRDACTHFLEIEGMPPVAVVRPVVKAEAVPAGPGMTLIDAAILAVIDANRDAEGWMPFAPLGALLHRDHRIRLTSVQTTSWRAYVSARPHLFVCETKGPKARIRRA